MIQEQSLKHWAFSKHLSEAIQVNKLRRAYYSTRTSRKSLFLSNLLIILEYLTYPIAIYFDLRGLAFQKKGVPLFTTEFLPMDIISESTPPAYTSLLDSDTQKKVNDLTASYKNMINYRPTLSNLYVISRSARMLIYDINNIQLKNAVHLSMTLHLAESIYLVSSNGRQHAQMCNDASVSLSMQLIRVHIAVLSLAINLDRLANKCHQLGVGILVNDLPTLGIE